MQDPEPDPSVKDTDPHFGPVPKCHGSGTLLRSVNLFSTGLFYYPRTGSFLIF